MNENRPNLAMIIAVTGFAIFVLSLGNFDPPRWVVVNAAALRVIAPVVAALIVLGGLALLIEDWNLHKHTRLGVRPTRPDDLPPGLAGLLAADRLRPEHITATLLDLARRGALTIDEGEQVTFDRVEGYEGRLLEFEDRLLDGLFKGRKGAITEQQLHAALGVTVEDVADAMRRDLVRQGLLNNTPKPDFHATQEVAAAGFALGGVTMLNLARAYEVVPNLWMVPAALIIVSFVLLAASGDNQTADLITRKGRRTRRRWRAYARHLETPGALAERLPDAISLGKAEHYRSNSSLSERVYSGLNATTTTLFETLDGAARTMRRLPIMSGVMPKRARDFTRSKYEGGSISRIYRPPRRTSSGVRPSSSPSSFRRSSSRRPSSRSSYRRSIGSSGTSRRTSASTFRRSSSSSSSFRRSGSSSSFKSSGRSGGMKSSGGSFKRK